jgi:signal transduction histidine kinase
MRPLRLSTLLIAVNVGLLLLAVAGVALAAVRLLEQFADAQALARVEQAGLIARQQIESASAMAHTSAQLLGERPTLRRLVEQNDTAALNAFLAQFQATSQLDGAAVLRDGRLLSASGAALPWTAVLAAQPADAPSFLTQPEPNRPLLLVSGTAVPELPSVTVGVTLQLDERFAERLGAAIRLPVTIVARQTTQLTLSSAEAALRQRALASGLIVSARLDERSGYVAVVPLLSGSGEQLGLIETTLPTSSVTRSLQELVSTLLLLALGVALLAAVASFLIGRRLGWPLQTLTSAAARIGRGDLTTPIPALRGGEIGTLSATLEEMRWRLMRLTADLRRQQAEAHAIVTGIVEGVFTVDRQRRIRYLNPQAAAALGVSPEAAIGRFCGDVLNPQGPGGVRPCAEHCPIVHARFRGGVRATEHLLLPNGQRRTVVITSAPPAEEQQVQVIRDETEVEAVRGLRDAVLANISHEFRTPLSAQLASIELLLDQLPDLPIEQIGQLVLSLQRGTLRLTQLIDNLLESVRIEAGQRSIRRQPVALDEVVEEAIELMRPLLDQRGQQVVVELPYPLPSVRGDATRLTLVFVNLLANANKYAPAGSTIQIGGEVQPTSVLLWVADQGPGLPALAGQTIFGRFVRASAEEPEQSGMGLGLWIVKSIVERHGGRVDADSRGAGTQMRVLLPREQRDEDTGR